MIKVEFLPTQDCEAGYDPGRNCLQTYSIFMRAHIGVNPGGGEGDGGYIPPILDQGGWPM